jgi:peptide/nickel transport system substrate-binding protein
VVTLVSLFVALIFLIACGGTAATPVVVEKEVVKEVPKEVIVEKGVVKEVVTEKVVVATPVPGTAMEVPRPAGTLDIGYQENLGVFSSHPRLTGGNYALFVGTTLAEDLASVTGPDENFAFKPRLAKEWSVSPDNLTWIFKLREGVPFHKGYGEVTADDVIWSYTECAAEGTRCNGGSKIRRLWFNDKGYTKKVDDYTIEVHTGEPQFDMLIQASTYTAGFIMSKKQVDDLGEEAASQVPAATGPWEFAEARTGEFWRFEAVQDHWRKTPNFAELVLHDIPEESTRLANFQTGKLDTFVMQLDSKPAVETVSGVKFMRVEGGGTEHIAWMGNFYVGMGTPDQREGYDASLPWVSSNPDVNSEEWKQAVKVRRAMAMAIDKQSIVDNILNGEGKPGIIWGWEGNEHRLPPDIQKGYGYDPEGARQLLAEAGYPDGFEITVTPSIRGVPGEVDACFAVATMWEDIGIRTRQENVLYPTFRLLIKDKKFNQANCHGTGGRSDPMTLHPSAHSGRLFGAGFTHPTLDELITTAISKVDPDERWEAAGNIARFVYDNSLETSLYSSNILWPLGPEIDSWKEHLNYADRRILSSTEYTPHRK